VIFLLLLFVAGRCLVPMDETDLFFNLRLGEIVLGTGRVPTENLLSFTHPAATDINLAWLFQVVLALAHRAASIPGTVLLKTAFVAATWAVLFRVAVRRGAHPALAALALALSAWAAEPRFVERPHLVTFLGLALVLLAVERAENQQPRMLWWLVPCGLLWANANSCFFLAPTVLLLYALGARLDGRSADARRALFVALALIPLMFATPSGVRCLDYIANHFRMPYVRPLQEYRHARWPLDGPFFFLVAGLLAARLVPLAVRRLPVFPVPWRVLLPCALFALLGYFRIRFVAEFAILAGPALAVATSRLVPALPERWPRWLAGALLLGLTAAPRLEAVAQGGRLLDIGMEPDLVPLAAIDFAETRGLRHRMYNDLEVGSYLTWHGWPKYRVFQDPRINGYPEAFHAVLRRSDLSRPEWQSFLDSFNVASALVTFPSVNPRGALFDPEQWALVYRANDGLLFVRRPVREDLAEIPLSFSYSAATGLTPVPLTQPPSETSVSACEWQRRLGDYHRSTGDNTTALHRYESALAAKTDPPCTEDARVAAGALALQLGDASRAADLLESAPGLVARTNHGFALLALGHSASALADFDGLLRDDARNDEATFGRGLCLVALGRDGEAATMFEALLVRSPNHVSAKAARQQLARLRDQARGKILP
jgi:tetratricopeptide (TPR) repeat protein